MKRILVALLLVASLMFVGCEKEETPPEKPPETAPTTPPAAATE